MDLIVTFFKVAWNLDPLLQVAKTVISPLQFCSLDYIPFPHPHVKDNSLALASKPSQLLLTASLNLLLVVDTSFCFLCL